MEKEDAYMIVEKRRGRSSLLTINGVTKSTTEWAKETGIDVQTIGRRIREGWTEDNLFQKVKPAPHYEEEGRDGEYRSLQLSGKVQGLKILHYIYDDATVYLDRKYEKFLNIIEKLEGTNELQAV